MTTPDAEDKVLNRLKKMLALGNCMGTTEHERDAAMQQAYKLMLKHNLTEEDVNAHNAPEARDTYSQAGWSMVWARQATNQIADLFFCTYWWGRKINATKCYHYFVGKESNAKTAMLMTDYIVGSILKEGRTRYGDNLCPETRSFAVGCVSKLAQRIRKLKEEAAEEQAAGNYTGGTELILANYYESEQAANIAIMNPNVKEVKLRNKPVQREEFQAGQEFAETLSLNVRVDGKAPTDGKATDNLKIK
jgi:hypothetical protein